MALSRSTYYDKPSLPADAAAIVAAMIAVCDEFEACGYRRVGAELRHGGMAVNFKKISRPRREHGSQPQRRRRFVATTDNNHASLIFLDVARNKIVHGPTKFGTQISPTSRLPPESSIWRHLKCLVASGGWICDRPLDFLKAQSALLPGTFFDPLIDRAVVRWLYFLNTSPSAYAAWCQCRGIPGKDLPSYLSYDRPVSADSFGDRRKMPLRGVSNALRCANRLRQQHPTPHRATALDPVRLWLPP